MQAWVVLMGDIYAGATDSFSVQGNTVKGARSGMEPLITIIGFPLETDKHAFVALPSP